MEGRPCKRKLEGEKGANGWGGVERGTERETDNSPRRKRLQKLENMKEKNKRLRESEKRQRNRGGAERVTESNPRGKRWEKWRIWKKRSKDDEGNQRERWKWKSEGLKWEERGTKKVDQVPDRRKGRWGLGEQNYENKMEREKPYVREMRRVHERYISTLYHPHSKPSLPSTLSISFPLNL